MYSEKKITETEHFFTKKYSLFSLYIQYSLFISFLLSAWILKIVSEEKKNSLKECSSESESEAETDDNDFESQDRNRNIHLMYKNTQSFRGEEDEASPTKSQKRSSTVHEDGKKKKKNDPEEEAEDGISRMAKIKSKGKKKRPVTMDYVELSD